MKSQNRLLTLVCIPEQADAIADDYVNAGWLLSEMDKAGGSRAYDHIHGRAVTVGVDIMAFKKPVHVGDQVNIYTEIARQGRSSLTVRVESWAQPYSGKPAEKVTEGFFTFVAIDSDHNAIEITTPPPARMSAEGLPGRPPQARPATVAGKGAVRKTLKNTLRDSSGPDSKPPAEAKLSLRIIPMPADQNYIGDIFGGWILKQMDRACARTVQSLSKGQRFATVGLEAMTFHKPVKVGDMVSFYTDVVRVGTTSVTVHVETWARRREGGRTEKVTEGSYTYVALDAARRPEPVRIRQKRAQAEQSVAQARVKSARTVQSRKDASQDKAQVRRLKSTGKA